MPVSKLIALALVLNGCLSLTVFGQSKHDIGPIFSSDGFSRLGIEYRQALAQPQWKFKIGFTMGGETYGYRSNPLVMDASDSTVVLRYTDYAQSKQRLRLGVERQLSDSYFSVGADLNMGHYVLSEYRHSNLLKKAEDEWSYPQVIYTQESFDYASVSRHYLSTAVRLSFNLNVPISDHFLVHGSIAADLEVPYYIGESNRIDPLQDLSSAKDAIYYNFNMTGNIGLRYYW